MAVSRSPPCGDASYDFDSLAKLPIGARANVAEYMGPVEVAHIPGKGRGLRAARPIVAGELLFANAAFAASERTRLVEVAVHRLERCSQEECDAFFLLCDGKTTPSNLPSLVVPARSEAATSLRSVDRRRVRAILEDNAHELDTSDLCSGHNRDHGSKRLSGLFLVGSLLNHSCCPSAVRVFFGDTMFVRAARDLQHGDEITDGYISVLQPSFRRRSQLKERSFALVDDRAVVEEALMPASLTKPLLDQCDRCGSLEEFGSLAARVEELVWDRLTWLGDTAPQEVYCAASRISPALERMLCGSLMEVFLAIALFAQQAGKHGEAAKAYARCCCFMEENAPNNAYHAIWAMSALEEAKKAGYSLQPYIQYARKVLRVHCGPGALERTLRRSKLISRAEASAASGELNLPPGALVYTVSIKSGCSIRISVEIAEMSCKDLEVLLSPRLVKLIARKQRAAIVLPCLILVDAAQVLFVRRQRTLVLKLPAVAN